MSFMDGPKDTHLDLGMEMWITHNKSEVEYSTVKYTMATREE